MKPGVLIIGGEGDIGSALQRRFNHDGWQVMTTSRQDRSARSSIPLDLLDPDSIRHAFDQWSRESEDPCCVIQAGGSPSAGLIATLQEKEAFEILQLHAASALAVARAAARILIPKHRGHLLFFSSLAAVRPNPGQAAYAAGKGAIESLVRALAREWGSKNIRVNAIAPGYIDSKAVQEMNDSLREAKLNHLPAGRLGYPEEVAALASFLSSPRAAYITGQVLRIDGGASI